MLKSTQPHTLSGMAKNSSSLGFFSDLQCQQSGVSTCISFRAGIPVRPLEPLWVSRHAVTGDLCLEWRAGADKPENWPVVGFIVEAMDRRAAGQQ